MAVCVIQNAEGVVVAELQAEAVDLGWHIASIELKTGGHGDYEEVVLARKGFKA